MKKIVSLILVLILSLTMLVACDEDVIGEYDYPDYVPQFVEEINLNLYIIGGNPDAKAVTTVEREITAYTSAKFKVNLDIHYFTEAEYNAAVSADLAASDKSVDIVLINSEAMFEKLASANRLVRLDGYIATNKYGTLNASIARPLLDAAMYNDGENQALLCIPNNRVLGAYKYLCIDRQEGHLQGYSKTELDNMTTEAQFTKDMAELQNKLDNAEITQADYDKEKQLLESMIWVEELSAKITAAGKNPDDFIFTVEDGKYETKEQLEKDGYSCVILEKPQVTKADAYASAFAITTDCAEANYERAMEIIYAINTDVYLRNMLQFGVKNTNYYLDENNFVTFATGESEYIMALKYTGDLFLSYFVADVYTPATKLNGEKQNLEATYIPATPDSGDGSDSLE